MKVAMTAIQKELQPMKVAMTAIQKELQPMKMKLCFPTPRRSSPFHCRLLGTGRANSLDGDRKIQVIAEAQEMLEALRHDQNSTVDRPPTQRGNKGKQSPHLPMRVVIESRTP